MNAPVLTYTFSLSQPKGFSDLDVVRIIKSVQTDEGETVPVGTVGTIVGVWNDGTAYEVEFEAGLATVDAAMIVMA